LLGGREKGVQHERKIHRVAGRVRARRALTGFDQKRGGAGAGRAPDGLDLRVREVLADAAVAPAAKGQPGVRALALLLARREEAVGVEGVDVGEDVRAAPGHGRRAEDLRRVPWAQGGCRAAIARVACGCVSGLLRFVHVGWASTHHS